jgi:pimeloyl-ACP methyl ester carboxylesterase
MPEVQIPAGTIEYAEHGRGDGPPVVLIGGLAIGPSLWDGVVAELRGDHRVIVPTLPWGAHRKPMREDADLTLRGHARILADFLDALDLRDVTLVENDTGMAQLLAGERPERLGRVVITSCEAFDNYPPGLPGKMIGLVGRLPGGVWFAMQQLRLKPLRRSPMTFGRMAKRPIPDDVFDGWLEPLLTQRAIRRDLEKYIRTVDKRVLLDAAERLRSFDRPALVAWAKEDKVMPPEHGRRLADLLPQGRLVEIEDSYTLIPLDQPRRLAAEIAAFIGERGPAPAPAGPQAAR